MAKRKPSEAESGNPDRAIADAVAAPEAPQAGLGPLEEPDSFAHSPDDTDLESARTEGGDDDRARRIAERAYELWEREGRPDGRADANWTDAERELNGGT